MWLQSEVISCLLRLWKWLKKSDEDQLHLLDSTQSSLALFVWRSDICSHSTSISTEFHHSFSPSKSSNKIDQDLGERTADIIVKLKLQARDYRGHDGSSSRLFGALFCYEMKTVGPHDKMHGFGILIQCKSCMNLILRLIDFFQYSISDAKLDAKYHFVKRITVAY